ncbi:MAG: hypothetical protein HFF01_02615 [Erysipelotrichaceae bacterium]|nr:hypothetical protein [Erysipelotrichaceae bacterium]MCI9312527.1 hypothetical protein [Erysipelotrichaceae bacterium]MCI9523931.1 hypothetical protein [Erysipelotrichaceae bacterium]
MDKTKVSIIKAIAMSKTRLALDNDYLKIVIKALQWESKQVQDSKVSRLCISLADDVKRYMNGTSSAIVDSYTLFNVLYYRFAQRQPIAYSINEGKKDAFDKFIGHIRYIMRDDEEERIRQAQDVIMECKQKISEAREEMESIKAIDTSAIKLENRKGNDDRLLKYMEIIQDQEDNIAVYELYMVLMRERKKQKQAFINSLDRDDRCLLIDYMNEKHYEHDEVAKVLTDHITYWDQFVQVKQ